MQVIFFFPRQPPCWSDMFCCIIHFFKQGVWLRKHSFILSDNQQHLYSKGNLSLVTKCMSYRARLPGFEFINCHLLALKPWTSYLRALYFSFFICKMDIIITTSQIIVKMSFICVELIVQKLVFNKC